MKFLLLTLLTQILTSAPLLTEILGTGGILGFDLSGWNVIGPSTDTTKVNINKGYGNYAGPQYTPGSYYGGYSSPAAGSSATPQFGNFQQSFNPGFQGGSSAQGFPQESSQARGNQLKPQHT